MARVPAEAFSPNPRLIQTLHWMRKQGFKPVPLHPQSKAAISRDYVSLSYRPPGDDLWTSTSHGLGIATGPLQGGPIDIDLDCDEAIFFAPRFLPPTDAVFGRDSKPRSHLLYRVTETSFEKQAFLDPLSKNATIVEMRGDGGHQTVMPGSVHEASGEAIDWQGSVPFPEVTSVNSADLIRAVRKIAFATLIVRHVWQSGYHNEPCKHLSGMLYYLEWTLEETENVVRAIMDYTGDTDKSRLPTVRATFKRGEAGRKVSGAGVLRKQLKDDALVDRLLELAGSPTVNLLQEYNDRFAVVAIEGKFRIADTEVPAGEPPVFFVKDDWLNFVSTDYSGEVSATGKPKSKGAIWLAHPRRRSYRSIDFMPGRDDEAGVLNLWTGWGVEPSPEGSCEHWLRLLREVICGGDEVLSNWLIHWFANIVREPEDKSLTAPVLIGPEGAGKTLLVHYFGRILGAAYTAVTHEEHIYGHFNQHLASTLLLHSEEALHGGERKHANLIRSLITDPFRMFEPKNINPKQVRNLLRLVLTSNEIQAAPARPGDRRYTIFNLKDRKADPVLVQAVLKEMKNGGPGALHRYLLDMDYDPAIPRTNIKNDDLIGLKSIGSSPIEGWWHETLMRGQTLPDYLSWCTQPEREDWPEVVSSLALHAAMSIHLKDHGARNIPNATMLALQLNKFTGETLRRSYRNFEDPLTDGVPPQARNLPARQYAVVNLPTLEQCRAAFEKHIGQPVEWPGPDDTPRRERKGDNF